MAIDVHVHTRGPEDGEKILKALDYAGLERVVLFGVPPHRNVPEGEKPPADAHKQSVDNLVKMCAPDPERLIGFAWIEPTLPDAVEGVEYAFGEHNLWGVKMIPNHWFPADERAQACYAKMEEFEKPLLVHTGILWGLSDTSQHCRPAFFEILLEYPKIRFAMAHMSWPWTDECFAVCGKFRAAAGRDESRTWTSFVDITTGAPRIWKVDALRKALSYLGNDQIIYGSDCFEAENGENLKRHLDEDRSILEEAGATPEVMERILTTNALRWLGIRS
jgi:predicted TIM-barrel fold metal-dependent hydrolase